MKALVKNNDVTTVEEVEIPALDERNNVLIRVKLAGICRTDINVSKGIMPSAATLILGHEFYGEVAAITPDVTRVNVGDKVTIDPSKYGHHQDLMCGIDVDGAFGEYIKAPAAAVYKLPESLSPEFSAYIEPIAASLAVLNANLDKAALGCIYGDNRIARLTHKIMQIRGYENVSIHNKDAELAPHSYDYIIETVSKSGDITRIIEALKVGGTLVLKSRQVNPVEIVINTLVRKEITMQAVNYGDYDEAIELLASGELDLSDLTGNIYPLEEFEKAFTASEADESRKCYFQLCS